MIVAGAILTTWALYLVAMNVFLSTPLFEKVVDFDAAMLDVRFKRGWSIIPGRIHGEMVTVRSSDSNVQWVLRIDEVDFNIELGALLRRKFHICHTYGTGVSFWARRKRPAPELTAELADALPPIPGFGRLPIRPPEPKGAERWDDSKYSLFTIQLDDTMAFNTTDVWIDEMRFRGHMNVKGGFYLKPIREAFVGPNEIEFFDGTEMTYRGRVIATNVDGEARMSIDRFDPRTTGGDELIHKLSVETDLHGIVPDIHDLPEIHENAPVHGEVRVARLSAFLDHGVVRPDAVVDATVEGLTYAKGDIAFRTHAIVKTVPHEKPERIHANVEVENASLLRRQSPLFVGGRAHVAVDAPPIDVTAPDRGVHALATIVHVTMPSPAAIADVAPSVQRGSATAEGELETWVDQHRARADVKVHAKDVAIHAGDALVSGGFDAHASAASFDWQTKVVEAPHVRVVTGPATVGFLSADRTLKTNGIAVTADTGSLSLDHPLRHLDVTAKGHVAGDTRIGPRDALLVFEGDLDASASAGNFEPDAHHLGRLVAALKVGNVRGTLREGFTAPDFLVPLVSIDALVDDLDTSHPKLGDADLHVVAKAIMMPNVRALDTLLPNGKAFAIEKGTARADADIRVAKGAAKGELTVDLERAEMRVQDTRLAGNFRLTVPVRDYDPKTSRVDITGTTMTMRDVWARGSSSDTTHWNGNVTLANAGLCFDDGGALDAKLGVHFDDAKPVLAIAVGDKIPGFLAGFVRAPELHGNMHVTVSSDRLGVRDVNLQGGDVRVWGAYAAENEGDKKAKDGGFIVKKGVLAAGIGIGDESSGVHFFGLDAWLAERTKLARNLAACPAVAP